MKRGAKQHEVRIALRVEGKFWTAYLAKSGTMEGCRKLGSILMDAVADQERKVAFMDLMQSYVTDVIKAAGSEALEWEQRAAPEHERVGNA